MLPGCVVWILNILSLDAGRAHLIALLLLMEANTRQRVPFSVWYTYTMR